MLAIASLLTGSLSSSNGLERLRSIYRSSEDVDLEGLTLVIPDLVLSLIMRLG